MCIINMVYCIHFFRLTCSAWFWFRSKNWRAGLNSLVPKNMSSWKPGANQFNSNSRSWILYFELMVYHEFYILHIQYINMSLITVWLYCAYFRYNAPQSHSTLPVIALLNHAFILYTQFPQATPCRVSPPWGNQGCWMVWPQWPVLFWAQWTVST